MKYTRVFVDSINYELPPVVVTSSELEARLKPMYEALHISEGQLDALTGIVERRWWEEGYEVSQGAIAAARKTLDSTPIKSKDIEVLIYAGVCRENFEPATACRVSAGLGINGGATVYDVSNACLGVLNGMLDIANRIELGQIKAGLVVACETAREINEIMIRRMLEDKNMEMFATSLATLTGGSGAVAVLLTDGSFSPAGCRRLLGGVTQTASEHYGLCRWGVNAGQQNLFTQSMSTDSVAVMKYGVELGKRTWEIFLKELGWNEAQVDKIICHQVGSTHQDLILRTLGIPAEKDFPTYKYLGNMGTASLPVTAALAEENEFLNSGDHVGFLGIGSGLNCIMLGLEW
jgi:3-oxoacyl-[acyl-carrier-protein] synthase-3